MKYWEEENCHQRMMIRYFHEEASEAFDMAHNSNRDLEY